MTTSNKRYLVVKNPTVQNITQLDNKNFIPLKNAVHPDKENETMIFVDTKLLHFWKVDSVSLINAEEIVRDKFEDNLLEIESQQLKEYL